MVDNFENQFQDLYQQRQLMGVPKPEQQKTSNSSRMRRHTTQSKISTSSHVHNETQESLQEGDELLKQKLYDTIHDRIDKL